MIAPRTKHRLWRIGSLAVFCGGPILLLGLIVSNAMDATQASDQAARKHATTSSIVAQLERHRARAAPVDTTSLYLASTSGSLASAEIQERATKFVTQSGGRLAEVQLNSTPEQEAAGTVTIRLALDIDNKGLLNLLYAMETGLPLLVVTDLSVQKIDGQREERAGEAAALHVDLTVKANWRKSA